MAEPLKVDSVLLHGSGQHVASAADEAATAFVHHENDLLEAASGWVGESAEALRDLTSALAARHTADHAAVAELGEKMAATASAYTAADGDAAEPITRIASKMGL